MPNEVLVLGQVALAMLLGSVVGLERELAGKPAGLRTHMLVAGAAGLLVALGDIMLEHFALVTGFELIRSDPIRIVEAIITGISFLGAGTIIRSREKHSVEGLTTAASILLVAAIGATVALSQWILAVGVTILALITLRVVIVVEQWVKRTRGNAES
ncbi:MAG: MgtC/SapB family protein [Chloroflexota bacterium]|nr:MgtC/SapB family protein [Chloroflexota bacterium]